MKDTETAEEEKNDTGVNSPEELNDYIRVTTPPVWMTLIALVVLTLGILAYCIWGTVDGHQPDGSIEKIHPISFLINNTRNTGSKH